jgi:hypothetical protein
MDLRKGTCPLCNHHEVVAAVPQDFDYADIRPLAIAHDHSKWWGTKRDSPFGILNAFVCRGCGFTQWFADRPKEIPIGQEYGTRLVKAKQPGDPYR